MPSPVGHSFIGLAIAWARFLPRGSDWRETGRTIRKLWRPLLFFIFIANAADVDYLPGVLTGHINEFHHFYTHTMVWALLVAMGAWLCWKSVNLRIGWRELFFLLALTLSHLVADYLTADSSVPYGIMVWWPVSNRYYLSAHPLFMHLQKATWGDVFQFYNIKAVWHEAVLTLPLLLCVLLFKHRSRS